MKNKLNQHNIFTDAMMFPKTLLLLVLVSLFLSLGLPGLAHADADLAITKGVSNASPIEGESIIYSLTLTNNGTQNAAQLEVTDTLPPGVTYVSDDSGGDYDNTTGLWTPNPIQNGNSRTINITVTVDAGTAGSTITNTATITNSNRVDPDSSNDVSSVDITITGPDLAISKSVNNTIPVEGETITYTLTLTNNGPRDATVNQVTDLLPAGLTYVSDDGAGSYNNVTGIWSPAALNSGSSTTLNIIATVDAGTTGSTITNTASVTTSTPADPVLANNSASVAITVSGADLAIVKSVDNATPGEGDTIVYTLTLNNNGPRNATNLEVTDVLPVGITYVSDDSAGSYDNSTGLWTPNTLNSGASDTLNITATVDAGTAGSTITNTATITNSNRIDPDASNDTSSVDITVVAPDITLLKSSLVSSDPVNGSTNPKAIPGATVLYSVQVTNQGLGSPDVDSMIITDPIPANTSLIAPVTFIDGTPGSNLSFTFTGLDNGTDDVEFSTDGGTSWTANGSDPGITHIRMRPKGTFAASDGTNHPNFILRFQVIVQ